jgi:NAD(P)-dependent dehydrogenase (short-subunit alcohol dehydrogenase family)
VAQAGTADRVADAAAARGWRVANIIANAGFGKTGAVAHLPDVHLQSAWGVNVMGAVHLLRRFVPEMAQAGAGGTVVLMSSYVHPPLPAVPEPLTPCPFVGAAIDGCRTVCLSGPRGCAPCGTMGHTASPRPPSMRLGLCSLRRLLASMASTCARCAQALSMAKQQTGTTAHNLCGVVVWARTTRRTLAPPCAHARPSPAAPLAGMSRTLRCTVESPQLRPGRWWRAPALAAGFWTQCTCAMPWRMRVLLRIPRCRARCR